ncbi:MAG: hypothetical protein PHN51_10170 [Candidatus Nanopelagicales bacterium]|nr:hypothetical protein [Candidatus Nanopelagicales bacterium]
MKVVFKLNLGQLARARAQVLKVERSVDLDQLDNYEGNLVGWVEDHGFSYNSNQRLDLIGDCITYVGERCPFQQDGMFRLLGEILTGEKDPVKGWWENHHPVTYETSDTWLRWHETLHEWLYARASISELLAYIAKPNSRWGDVRVIPALCSSVKNNGELLTAVKAVANHLYRGRGNEKTLAASFSPATLKVATVIAKATHSSWF